MEGFVRDGLRLARGMTRKCALAGLWWGGGKGLIARQPGDAHRDPAYRRRLYREYGAFVSSLRGCYVTAEDVGTTPLDMAEVFGATRFATSVPQGVGGTGNPSPWTAAGVVCAMEAGLEFLGRGSLEGTTIAMQGTGNVGSAMIAMLLEKGVARITASEICSEQRAALESAFDGRPVELRAALPGDCEILAEPCDLLAPNALGGVLNAKTHGLGEGDDRVRSGEQPARQRRSRRPRPERPRHRLRAGLRRQPHGYRRVRERAVRKRGRRPDDPAPPRSRVFERHPRHGATSAQVGAGVGKRHRSRPPTAWPTNSRRCRIPSGARAGGRSWPRWSPTAGTPPNAKPGRTRTTRGRRR